MTHRMAVEDLLYRRNIANTRAKGPSISQEELDAQKAAFFAAGGKVSQIPIGTSGEVIEYKPKPSRALCKPEELDGSVGTMYVAERLGVPAHQARRLIKEARLPFRMHGTYLRLDKAVVDEWLAKRGGV